MGGYAIFSIKSWLCSCLIIFLWY